MVQSQPEGTPAAVGVIREPARWVPAPTKTSKVGLMDPIQTTFETLAVSWITNQIIGYLKRAAWAGWVTQEAATVSRLLASVITFIGTFGVVLVCGGDSAGGWNCTLTIPPAAQLQTFVLRWIGTLSWSNIQYEISQAGKVRA